MRQLHLQNCLTLACYGACIGIHTNAPAVLARIEERMPLVWQRTTSRAKLGYALHVAEEGGSHRLWMGRHRVASAASIDELLDTLESLLHFDVAMQAKHHLFVHAGAVGWRGCALVLPGKSRSGKTTIVEALVRAGATYLSDEYAVLDLHGLVHPYPKLLSIRGDEGERPRQLRVEALGGRVATSALPVGLIAVMAHQPGIQWHPQILSPGEALLGLLANTVLARVRSQFALKVLGAAVRGVPGLSGIRGEADQTAVSLLEFLERTHHFAPD